MTIGSGVDKDVTQILGRFQSGDQLALNELFPLVYAELRQIANRYMRQENAGHTLQATALVNEAYFRLVGQDDVAWQNRAHFYGIAANVMRRILVDHARGRGAAKRGGECIKLNIDDVDVAQPESDQPDLVALDGALEELATLNQRQAKVVEMRFFAGLSMEEISEALDTSLATVKRDWNFARAWLHDKLSQEDDL